MLGEVYRMASYSFGEPPATFDWEYRDDDKNYHREAGLTPKSFYENLLVGTLRSTFQSSMLLQMTNHLTTHTQSKCWVMLWVVVRLSI